MQNSPNNRTKGEILIVDDSLPNLRLLSAMLISDGFIVREAPDGPAALKEVDSSPPDLILLDVRMPEMDGYEVCEQLKANQKSSQIPVIFVSALDDQADRVHGFLIGGVDYISKPFQVKEVLARVGLHLTLRNLQKQLEAQNQQLQHEVADRIQAQVDLQQANDELERRVKERTYELAQSNARLLMEITERERGEAERENLLEQIREQAQQVREIINSVPEGVLVLDNTHHILLTNPAGQEYIAVLTETQAGGILTQLGDKPLIELLASPPHGLWHEVKSGKHTFEVIARPMVTASSNEQWVMVVREVSQEREVQQQSQQQNRLAAIGQLAAGIAHDFNNIMAVILLYNDLALTESDLSPKLRERLQIVTQQAKRATHLTQQILDFGRRAVIERRPMDIASFLKEQIKLLERAMPENIQLGLTYGTGEYLVEADPTRIQQIFMNLAVNARDALPDGGRFHITISRLDDPATIHCTTCGVITGGKWVQITATDSGAGIPAEIMPRIFEPFFTTKPYGMGTGLGLAQVYGIIKQHDGHIDVNSKLGQGTTFHIYLPALPVSQPDALELVLPAFHEGQRQTILLVEDDAAARQALVEGLELLNYHIIQTGDGKEALQVFDRHDCDVRLVLCDVVMPEMGGIAMFHELRQRGISVPVILMTGHPLQEEMDKLKDGEMVTWLPKPPSLRQLAQTIAQVLQDNKP